MGHIHRGVAGTNGVVAYPFTLPNSGNGVARITGNVVLNGAPGDKALLLSGGLYINFHTVAHSGGELRGQIVPATPPLRLPVYASARPASQMSAQSPKLALSKPTLPSATTAITLAGTGLQ